MNMKAINNDEREWVPASDGHCSEGRSATPPRTRVARAVTAPGGIRYVCLSDVCAQECGSCHVRLSRFCLQERRHQAKASHHPATRNLITLQRGHTPLQVELCHFSTFSQQSRAGQTRLVRLRSNCITHVSCCFAGLEGGKHTFGKKESRCQSNSVLSQD